MCFIAISTGDSPPNGTRAVSSSKRTMPVEYRSEVWSTGAPRACSGERYCAVPMIAPSSVIWLAPARAIPKSVTLTTPSGSTMTLCGLMSRCTTPLRCA